MRTSLLTITLSLMLVSYTFATSRIFPRPFAERIKAADHILFAEATRLEILDASGKPVTPPEGSIEGLTYRLTIEPTRTLKTNANKIPKVILFTYSHGAMTTYQWERDRFVGKKLFYLLRGPDFSIADPHIFTEVEEAEPQIKELLEKIK